MMQKAQYLLLRQRVAFTYCFGSIFRFREVYVMVCSDVFILSCDEFSFYLIYEPLRFKFRRDNVFLLNATSCI
jgi:hypothetical protein